jgi:hypothetical protein
MPSLIKENAVQTPLEINGHQEENSSSSFLDSSDMISEDNPLHADTISFGSLSEKLRHLLSSESFSFQSDVNQSDLVNDEYSDGGKEEVSKIEGENENPSPSEDGVGAAQTEAAAWKAVPPGLFNFLTVCAQFEM